MYRLYAKVFIVILIAYGYSHTTAKLLLHDYGLEAGIFLLLFLGFLRIGLGRLRVQRPVYEKWLLSAIILIAFSLLIGMRYDQTQGVNPFEYWREVKIPTGKNRGIFYLARIRSMDGFKRERYQSTLELISSHHDERWMSQVFNDLKRSLSNASSVTDLDFLSNNLTQDLSVFPEPILIQSLSYLYLPALNPGDIIAIRPYFIRKTEDINEGSSYRSYLIANGIYGSWYYSPRDIMIVEQNPPPLIFSLWQRIKDTINRDITYPSSTLAYAMFTGNKEEMPDYIKEYFRSTGTYHVLAVSGMHAGLLSVFFFYIFRIMGMRKKTSLGLIFLTVLPAYLFITNFQISIQRTYLMGLIGFLLLYFDRSVNLMSVLCLSFVAVTLYNPPIIYSVSFQLSFAAVFGIAHALRLLSLFRVKNAFINGLWVSVGAQLGTLPIVIFYFGYNNFLSLIYNIVVSFLISAYYLYTLIFLFLGIPLSLLPARYAFTDFLMKQLGEFLTLLGNILFAFLHYTKVEFEWFYFPSWQNQLFSSAVMGVFLFFIAESLYVLKRKQLKEQFSKNIREYKKIKSVK